MDNNNKHDDAATKPAAATGDEANNDDNNYVNNSNPDPLIAALANATPQQRELMQKVLNLKSITPQNHNAISEILEDLNRNSSATAGTDRNIHHASATKANASTANGDTHGSAKSAPGRSIASSSKNAIPDDQGVPAYGADRKKTGIDRGLG